MTRNWVALVFRRLERIVLLHGPSISIGDLILQIMRDPDTGNSKGYAFINFASFRAADAAIESMNGQYLCNRSISISYAFKKDSKGERHGTPAGSATDRVPCKKNSIAYEGPILLSVVSIKKFNFCAVFDTFLSN